MGAFIYKILTFVELRWTCECCLVRTFEYKKYGDYITPFLLKTQIFRQNITIRPNKVCGKSIK